MNVHHLELFYYVARFRGISRAVRHMPYGIQQPAVSSQVLQLEQSLGKRLFERTPFRLTTEGETLFAFVRPFFENLDTVAAQVRQQAPAPLRIGASEIVLRDHLPNVLAPLRQAHPELRFIFRSGFQAEMEALLQERELDLAIVPLETRPPARIHWQPLLQVPLVLLVPTSSKLRRVEDLWSQSPVAQPLITLPSSESATRHFREGLQRLKVDWPVTMEASSLDLIARYVANGYGYGVAVEAGDLDAGLRRKVRKLTLTGFPSLELAVLWQGEAEGAVKTLLDAIVGYAQQPRKK